MKLKTYVKKLSIIFGITALLAFSGCLPATRRMQKVSMFIGIDVSGSFYNRPYFDSAGGFTAYYIYAHLNGLGELKQPKALFVGTIGGVTADEPKAFHPIHDFEGKSLEQIEGDLRRWFTQTEFDKYTDFNIFFDKVATLAKKQNLVLSPIEIIIISDGIPDIKKETFGDDKEAIKSLKLNPLEYIARRVTVRLLYPIPTIAGLWDKLVERRRVKIWTQDNEVMAGWKEQLLPDKPVDQQEKLFLWIKDNIDFRVRSRGF